MNEMDRKGEQEGREGREGRGEGGGVSHGGKKHQPFSHHWVWVIQPQAGSAGLIERVKYLTAEINERTFRGNGGARCHNHRD